ncbi:MAG TPA: HAMP domain-containing sensor histidine kinase [Candidatus Limnocylindrales bacterium]
MIEQVPERLPAQPPTVSPPRPYPERRVRNRRTADQTAHEENALLTRSLDVLASDNSAEERLAGLLRLLARTVGARRAAVMADGIERRAAVAIDPAEDPAVAEELAAWLDAHAPRSRARRAAAGAAPISFILAAAPTEDEPPDEPKAAGRPVGGGEPPHYALLPIPAGGEVVLGFEFARRADADRLAERLPPTLARHTAVVLALVTSQLATEREIADLRARDGERSTFVSTVAHELRTPLTGLRGYLELILAGKVGDPAVEHEFLQRSRSIVDSMGELVGDLLELSRIGSGTLGLEIGPFSLAEAGGQVAAGLLPIAIERGVRLSTSFPPRLRVATGDRRRVEQIVTNLAANALKFTPSGGSVELEARVDGTVALVLVRDDGGGIPADDRARIFERFHRMAGHERITGTGLGLPIARELARRMDGDLDVASVPGAGSAFILALPGPTDVDAATIAAALQGAVAEEEIGLEERAVRRAVAAGRARSTPPDAGRPGSARLRALPPLHPETPAPA